MFDSTVEAGAYLSGLIDGEGSVRIRKGKLSGEVAIFNTDQGIIDAAVKAYETLGIVPLTYTRTPRPKPGYAAKLDCHTVVLSNRRDIETLAPHIKLRCERKQQTLQHLLGLYTQHQ
jgi:hypothetical protein